MKNIFFLFLAAFIIPFMAISQPTLIPGGSFEKFDGINNRIANFPQYKKLPDYMATIEIGWLKERHRIISGAGLNFSNSMSGHRDEKSSDISSIGVHADIGYDIIGSKMIMLYPLAGIGYEMYHARFFKDNTGVNFNDVLQSSTVQNSIDPVSFKNSFITYRLGLGLSLKSPKYPSNSIGLQAGYIGSFSSHSWKSNDGQDLMNAPVDKLSKVYSELVLAFSPWMMMKEKHEH